MMLLAAASHLIAATPKVGDRAADFQLSSLEGRPVRLSEETAKGPVVLVVLRGFPGYQCPFCNRQVQDFSSNEKAFAEAGVRVLLVYPGPPDHLDARASEFVADKKLPGNFIMALDPGYSFTNLYGLRWDAPRETAYPSTFVIGQDGVVTLAKISREHGGRTMAAEILQHLHSAKGQSKK